MPAKLNKFMCSLKGKKLTMFRMLMEMVVSTPSPFRNSKPSSPRKRKNMKSLSGKSNMRKHEMMNYA